MRELGHAARDEGDGAHAGQQLKHLGRHWGSPRLGGHCAAQAKVAAAGESLLSPAVTTRVIERFARRGGLRPAPALEELTPRELEVLRLLARGLSNAEIAERLVIGDATVKTHVARVLLKLDVRDRVQAVVAAYESGVVQPGRTD